jgi:hypothetical protein
MGLERSVSADVREGDILNPDPIGIEFATMNGVREEAARALGDLARDNVLSNNHNTTRDISIEIRDIDGPVMVASISFRMLR